MDQSVIAVTGATGFVGRHVASELCERGHHVRALMRDRDKARDTLDDRVQTVAGDITDAHALDDLTSGADACIHLVGIIREAPGGQTFEHIHMRGTETVVEACMRAGVRRYLHMSALGVGADGVCDYQRTKYVAEQIVRRTDLDWTIFRPSLIHGPGSSFISMVASWVRGEAMPRVFLPYFTRSVVDRRVVLGPVTQIDPVVAPVAVQDVAWCFAEALQRDDAIGEVYNITGPDAMSFPDMLRRFRDAIPRANRSLEPKGVPATVAAHAAHTARMLKLGSLLPFDRGMALMGACDSIADTHKARAHLSWTPRPFQATLNGYARSL